MSKYEDYLKEKLANAEKKIESLYYQLSLEQHETAKNAIEWAEMPIRHLQEENKQLKEALRKCSPWMLDGGYECESCSQIIVDDSMCEFCGNTIEVGHADDCEYVRLTKESEGEG